MRVQLLAASIAAALSLLHTSDARAQSVFEETFTDPAGCTTSASTYFPATWTRFNVDNRTPNAAVSYVNNAWVARGNFDNVGSPPTDCVAFSTSWYTPGGAANDFMCTPQINLPVQSRLSWQAGTYDASYRDGYEVRIMRTAPTGGTGTIGNLLTNSQVIFSVAEEVADTLVPHAVDLHTVPAGQGGPYANEPVHVCFRNNSFDKFLLIVDNVKVDAITSFDGVAQAPLAPSAEYTIIPATIGSEMQRGASVRNNGIQPLTNVTLTAETLLDGNVIDTDVSTPIATLAPGATQAITFAPAPLDTEGTYSVRYTVDATETDVNAANDVVTSDELVVSDEYARDDGTATGSLGIGAGNGGELGQSYEIEQTSTVTALHFWIAEHNNDPKNGDPGWPGSVIVANLRSFDTVNNEPGPIIASTEPFTAVDFAALDLTLEFPVPQVLTPGTYVVTVTEPAVGGDGQPGPNLALEVSAEIFTPGKMWVIWPTSPLGGWANVEEFGASFQRPFRLRMVFGEVTPPPDAMFTDGFEDAPPPPTVSAPRATGDATSRNASTNRTLVPRNQ